MLLSLTIQSGPGSNRWSAGLVYSPHVSAFKLPESSLAWSLKSVIGAHPEQSEFALHQWFLRYGERTPRASWKAPYTLSVKMSDFIVWRHTWRKNWVNCADLTGNSAGLRTVFSSRLLHRELRSSLRESHSFLSVPADTTMVSSQDTSVSSNSCSRWASHDLFLFKYHFLLHILRFLFFFSDNVMAVVASKQQTTSLFLSTTVTRTRRHTELTKKTVKPDGKPVLCQRTVSSVLTAVFTQLNCTV